MTLHKLGHLLAGLLLCVAAGSAAADEIRVLSAGAAHVALDGLVPGFHAKTGHQVKTTFATVGDIQQRLRDGEGADLVIVSKEALDELQAAGLTVRGARIDLGAVQVGVAVKAGAPRPDIATPEAFKKTLLAAKSIAAVDPAKGGTSGIHFAKVLEQLGIADQVRDKLVLVAGGYSPEKVASGEAELAVQQITEILPVKGVELVGPLPADLQKTTVYTGGIVMHTPVAKAAADLLRYLASPAGRAGFHAAGFAAPPK